MFVGPVVRETRPVVAKRLSIFVQLSNRNGEYLYLLPFVFCTKMFKAIGVNSTALTAITALDWGRALLIDFWWF